MAAACCRTFCSTRCPERIADHFAGPWSQTGPGRNCFPSWAEMGGIRRLPLSKLAMGNRCKILQNDANSSNIDVQWCSNYVQLMPDLTADSFEVSTVSRLGGCHGSICVNLPPTFIFLKVSIIWSVHGKLACCICSDWILSGQCGHHWRFSPQRGLPVPPLVLYHHQIQPHQSTHAISKGNGSQEKHQLGKISKVASACTCGRRHWSRRNPHWSLLVWNMFKLRVLLRDFP